MKKTIAGLVIAAAIAAPIVINQPPAEAVSGWSTYASLRSTDDFSTSIHASVDVRNPHSFRIRLKASPSQKVNVAWSYFCENGTRSAIFNVAAGSSSWKTKDLPRLSNPGEWCNVNIDVMLPNQDTGDVATVRAQIQVKTG